MFNKIKLSLFSDSQGRGVQRYVEEVSNGEMDAKGFVYPNAPLVQVTNSSRNSSDEVIVLLCGTNDTLSSDLNLKTIYSTLEKNLY